MRWWVPKMPNSKWKRFRLEVVVNEFELECKFELDVGFFPQAVDEFEFGQNSNLTLVLPN